MTASSPTAAAALEYARHGIPVLPYNSTTDSCYVKAGDDFSNATTDDGQVRSWWIQWPAANVAIPMGASSGLASIDVDVHAGAPDGRAAIRKLQTEHGKLPTCPWEHTPRGGGHLFFQYAPELEAIGPVEIAPSVEFFASRKILFVAPSIRHGKPYVWGLPLVGNPLPKVPAWVAELAQKAHDTRGRRKWTKVNGQSAGPVADVIPAGERHKNILSLAGTLRRRGLEAVEIAPTILAFNRRRCSPPYSDEDVLAKVVDVCSRYPAGDFYSKDKGQST